MKAHNKQAEEKVIIRNSPVVLILKLSLYFSAEIWIVKKEKPRIPKQRLLFSKVLQVVFD
jgi:hypothetical protein